MPFIDTHVHLADPLLPGAQAWLAGNETEGARQMPYGLENRVARRETAFKSGHTVLAIGSLSCSVEDPLGLKATKEAAVELVEHDVNVGLVGVIDPRFGHKTEHLARIDKLAEAGAVVAFKAYLGYLHFKAMDPRYLGYYAIAARHNIPVIFHTGGTQSTAALLKYAMPLSIDEVAVKYPKIQFVMAHFGNPWLLDAAAVILKNPNVWANLSAIVSPLPPEDNSKLTQHMKAVEVAGQQLNKAIAYAEASERLLFGTDWPAVDQDVYAEWLSGALRGAAPDFDQNAKRLFKLK